MHESLMKDKPKTELPTCGHSMKGIKMDVIAIGVQVAKTHHQKTVNLCSRRIRLRK